MVEKEFLNPKHAALPQGEIMLETLAILPRKSEPLPKTSQPKPAEQKSPEAFSEVMDRALSEQKALARELEQGKELKEKLVKAKQTLKDAAQNPEADPKAVEMLKEITDEIEKILGEGVEPNPLLAELAARLIQFVEQASVELSQTQTLSDGARYMGAKIAFVLEGLVQDIQNNTLSLAQKNTIKELAFQAQSAAADSGVLLARAVEEPASNSSEQPALFTQNPKEELEKSSEFSLKTPPSKDSQEPLFSMRDLRSKLEVNLKEQAVEAKLSKPSEEPVLFSALPKFEQAAQILQRAEAAFSPVPRAQMEALMGQVGARAVFTLRDGGSEFRMKLTPPELGQMKVSFRVDDGIMQGKIVVSTPEAKALFEENLNLLRESFRQAGLQIGQMDVSLGGSGDFEEARDIIENGAQYKAVRVLPPNPLELMSRGLTMSEIDYMA